MCATIVETSWGGPAVRCAAVMPMIAEQRPCSIITNGAEILQRDDQDSLHHAVVQSGKRERST
jgi:hypothetical protein